MARSGCGRFESQGIACGSGGAHTAGLLHGKRGWGVGEMGFDGRPKAPVNGVSVVVGLVGAMPGDEFPAAPISGEDVRATAMRGLVLALPVFTGVGVVIVRHRCVSMHDDGSR